MEVERGVGRRTAVKPYYLRRGRECSLREAVSDVYRREISRLVTCGVARAVQTNKRINTIIRSGVRGLIGVRRPGSIRSFLGPTVMVRNDAGV